MGCAPSTAGGAYTAVGAEGVEPGPSPSTSKKVHPPPNLTQFCDRRLSQRERTRAFAAGP